jgi:beta-aspartyl-peptidase (threonine type)
LVDPAIFVVSREKQRYEYHLQAGPPRLEEDFDHPGDTVGAVAIDRAGHLVAGTSTGGTLFKPVGRVGDSPLPGCGYYADNQLAAVSATGHGESIIRIQLARIAADFAVQLGDQASSQDLFSAPAEAAIHILGQRVDGRGGLIMIDRAGRVGYAYNTPHMARAYMRAGLAEPVVEI